MEIIKHYLFKLGTNFSIRDFIVISLVSILMGEFIYLTYRITHRATPDKIFSCSLLCYSFGCAVVIYTANCLSSIIFLVCIIVAGIIFDKVISSKYKDSQIFLVWSVACGVLCGEKQFIVSAIVCVIGFIIFWILKAMIDDMSKLLIIEGDCARELDVQAEVFRLFKKKAKLISKNTEDNRFKLVYKVSSNELENLRNERISVIDEIESNGGVKNVTICKEDSVDA